MSVGFGFQADVVSTAALGHLLTGRALQALQDGGIDVYAVAAAADLGKFVPVRRDMESIVHARVVAARRGGFQATLNKILSIGWGHAEIVVDLSRTRVGSNALLLIGALAAGSSTVLAAQCLSELLSLNGYALERLPNVDVLRKLVDYLAPFTYDLGFSTVLQHVTTTIESAMRARGYRGGGEPPQISNLGNAPMLAGSIQQLCTTARNGQIMYMVLKKRGSWLPAFASHILGMNVEVRYTQNRQGGSQDLSKDDIVWASAGTHGSVAFELGSFDPDLFSFTRTPDFGIEMVDCQGAAGCENLITDFPLQDALQLQLSDRPEFSLSLKEGICSAIARLSWTLLQRIRIREGLFLRHRKIPEARLNGNFDSVGALKDTLRALGLSQSSIDGACLPFSRDLPVFPDSGPTNLDSTCLNGLSFLDTTHFQRLSQHCPLPGHREAANIQLYSAWLLTNMCPQAPIRRNCLCGFVGDIIHTFGTSAAALLQCRFDASELRVKLSNGAVESEWVTECARWLNAGDLGNDLIIPLTYSSLLTHIQVLLSGETPELDDVASILGLSYGAYTVYFTAIMGGDAYDSFGRVISIRPGRASVNGLSRVIIRDGRFYGTESSVNSIFEQNQASSLAVGSFISPHYRPSAIKMALHARVDSHVINVHFTVDTARDTETVSLMCSIHCLLAFWEVPQCEHDKDDPTQIKQGREAVVVGHPRKHEVSLVGDDLLALVALRGSKLQQLVTCFTYSRYTVDPAGNILERLPDFDSSILQYSACLKCCLEIPLRRVGSCCIMMGG